MKNEANTFYKCTATFRTHSRNPFSRYSHLTLLTYLTITLYILHVKMLSTEFCIQPRNF
jgi:hypothetical protein